jgi:hypothetical protein
MGDRDPISKQQKKQPVKQNQKRSSTPQASEKKLNLNIWQWVLLYGAEILALLSSGLIAILSALGLASAWFVGNSLKSNLLPFAGSVLALALATSVLLWLWLRIRSWLSTRTVLLPAILALLIMAGAIWFATQNEFRQYLGNFRTLVGGAQEAERTTLAHQVYALYRRSDLAQVQRIIQRAEIYLPTIREAAEAYGIELEILVGIGATESSFYPRDSKDGGRGLFQITSPPKAAIEHVKKRFHLTELDPLNQRHNTFIGAATLQHYLKDMHNDLFLGLLAYNIGPRNGGLLSIMSQYGAKDFITIQPYLKNLPRDYPIRVLTFALAYRLWSQEGKLPRYEENDNALRVQSIGIPGLRKTGLHALADPP